MHRAKRHHSRASFCINARASCTGHPGAARSHSLSARIELRADCFVQFYRHAQMRSCKLLMQHEVRLFIRIVQKHSHQNEKSKIQRDEG